MEALKRAGGDEPIALLAVVKANAYGHGLREIAGLLSGRVAMLGELAPALLERDEPLPLAKPVSATHVECQLAHHPERSQ